MKVYVAEAKFDFEGGYVLGVFDSKEKAERCCTEEKGFSDSTVVTEWEVK
jgi:hypothetical protein